MATTVASLSTAEEVKRGGPLWVSALRSCFSLQPSSLILCLPAAGVGDRFNGSLAEQKFSSIHFESYYNNPAFMLFATKLW